MDLWDWQQIGTTVSGISLLVTIICVEIQRKKSESQISDNSNHISSALTRSRSASRTAWFASESGSELNMTSREPVSKEASWEHVRYHGPSVAMIKYDTWTPPPSWAEASTALMPQRDPPLSRILELDVVQQTLTCSTPGRPSNHNFTLPCREISVQCRPPVSMGVMEISLAQEIDTENRMEHTFESAQDAAKFQQDFITIQIMGKEIMAIYHALHVIYKGSSDEHEPVLHDDSIPTRANTEESIERLTSGVAWDDMMRALASIESIREYLEHILKRKRQNNENVRQRILLGPVDVFRAFLLPLTSAALPQGNTEQARFESILQRRKVVARASLYVRSYVQAQKIANEGWNLIHVIPKNPYSLTKRQAFDENIDNFLHDNEATNEYYEATVSRDVIYLPLSSAQTDGSSSDSVFNCSIQAFKLVGMHIFRLPGRDELENFPLTPDKDPVVALSSLRALVSKYPDQFFFISTFYPPGMEIVFVKVFVRALPKGTDEDFDSSLDAFIDGDEAYRSSVVHCGIQMGVDRLKLSVATIVLLWIVSMLLRLVGRSPVVESPTDRTVLPTIPVNTLGLLRHFGGPRVQNGESRLSNYVALSCHVDVRALNLTTIILLLYLERVSISEDILDFTFLISAPEDIGRNSTRALSTLRLVRLQPRRAALHSEYVHENTRIVATRYDSEECTSSSADADYGISWYVRALTTDPTVSVMRSLTKHRESNSLSVPNITPFALESKFARTLSLGHDTEAVSITSDPTTAAIDIVIDILRGILVPVRKDQLFKHHNIACDDYRKRLSTSALDESVGSNFIEAPILRLISHHDIRRYLVACEYNIKETAMRLVDSAAWRGLTFPIDIRSCRLELQNGQFFQQGFDLDGNPVLYFRNMLLGPWRGYSRAVISAVLHRLEDSIARLTPTNPRVRYTLIIMMGKPYNWKRTQSVGESRGPQKVAITNEHNETCDDLVTADENNYNGPNVAADLVLAVDNPRIQSDETYCVHTSKDLLRCLIDTLTRHHPERLHKALVVFHHGKNAYVRTAVGGVLALSSLVPSRVTRQKVFFLTRYADLRSHVSRDELVTIVGGNSPMLPSVFQCT